MKKNYRSLLIGMKGFLPLLLMLLGFQANSQLTYTFTTCGATGSVGPTQIQINNTYTNTNLMNMVVTAAGIQTWTVPVSGLYLIDITGASGGNRIASPTHTAGLGVSMKGEFNLSQGDVMKILVGQKGIDGNATGSGGGGTYVVRNTTLLIAAGGGGGATGDQNAADGTTLTTGTNDFPGGATPGGTNGGGGSACNGSGANHGGGGGGYIGNGATSTQNNASGGGLSFINGGTGGATPGNAGGFGGGGGATAAGSTLFGGGGGGGGYSGGAGGQQINYCQSGINRSGGGGGGSYNSGANQVNTAGANTGDGKVIFKELCSINLTASGSNSLNPSICAGQSLTLTTNAVSNYSWSTGAVTQTISVSPTSTTLYTLSAMSVSNCIAYASINVIVSGGQPTLSVVSSTNQTCLGKTATLTASGAVTYTWTGGVSNGVSFYPGTTTTYTVSGQNGCGITQAFTTISVSPIPVTTAVSSTAVCTNQTATITLTAAASAYTWQPVNISGPSPVLVVNPQTSTIYTISVSDGTCAGLATVAIQANPIPTITSAASSTIVCPGGTVGLTASGGQNYTWTPGPITGSNVTVSPSISTLYSVVGDNNFGCLSGSSQVVVAGTQPTLILSSSNSTVCNGDSSTLTVSGANTYVWSNGPTTTINIVSPTQLTTYTITGTNTSSGCTDIETISVDVFSPAISITGGTAVCVGNSINLNASGANTYTWQPGGTPFSGISVTPLVSTIYTVSGTATLNAITCPVSATIQVVVNPNPTITTSSVKPAICAKETNTLMAAGANNFTWTTATATTSGANFTVTSNNAAILVYTVTGTSAEGCVTDLAGAVTIYACAGINELNGGQEQLTVYPNPALSEFVVSGNSEMTLNLVNELGQLIKQIQLTSKNNYKVLVPDLPGGVYFIIGNNLSRKIIVAK